MRTAISLMGTRGYDGTSTRDIAAEAGVSVAALYYHFPSKLHLLEEFLHEAHDVVLARLHRTVAAAGPKPVALLDALVATLIWSHLHDGFAQLASIVAWREVGRLGEEGQTAVAAKREQIVMLLATVLAEGHRDHDFATTEPQEVARSIVTLCISVVDPFSEDAVSVEAATERYQRFARALANATPPPGPSSTPGGRPPR
ncbi:MAG: hypothetical protein NVS3B21_13850 [Acidimicrobiales bacterium]